MGCVVPLDDWNYAMPTYVGIYGFVFVMTVRVI